jgi:hypothetical protein
MPCALRARSCAITTARGRRVLRADAEGPIPSRRSEVRPQPRLRPRPRPRPRRLWERGECPDEGARRRYEIAAPLYPFVGPLSLVLTTSRQCRGHAVAIAARLCPFVGTLCPFVKRLFAGRASVDVEVDDGVRANRIDNQGIISSLCPDS